MLKLLANQQKDGDSPVKMVVQGFSRGKSAQHNGLRKFIMFDNHEAVRVGGLHKNMESRKVVNPKFTTDLSEAVVREGADELTLRADGGGALHTFIGTTNVGDKKLEATASRMRTGTPSARAIFKALKEKSGKGYSVDRQSSACRKAKTSGT